ncbi:hypothetical protein ABZ883_00155 [Streptomyces sp. NPDC046977]|uniref:hypothetical protein n=1 Tax=Streptomyces sp. NPDC046977 TaxID=3154703 RepID=UPI0033E5E91A
MAADDGIAWIGARWPDDDADPLLGVQAGLVFAEGIAPQDLAVVFGAVPWEMPEPVGAEAKAVWDRTHPSTCVPDEPLVTVYGKEGEWSFLAGHFDYLVPFREDFALPRGPGRAVLLYNIAAKGMYCMAWFEGGRLVWQGELRRRFDGQAALDGRHYFDDVPEPAFLNWAMHDAGCRPEVRYTDGRPVFEDDGRIADWPQRFLKGLEIAFGFSVCQETFDAGGYPLAAVHWS